jgi:putative transposase
MNYRRAFIPGGSWFFTLVTESRRPVFASSENISVLREAFRSVKTKHPFTIDAIVIMPEHLHSIWTLPPGDADFSIRWRLIKTWFTKHCDLTMRAQPNAARKVKNEQAVWQHRYWEHQLRDENDFARHVEYIHYYPVKHGHVSRPVDWEYSSFSRYVKEGTYPEDWGSSVIEFDGICRE